MKDLYYILGTKRDCTPAELNTAYRKLAEKFQSPGYEHDQFLNDHFEEITEAYQVLSDPARRRKYDTAYKKNYQRRLYYFKIRHLNVAAVITLIAFTMLFGYYVIRTVRGRERVKKTAATVTAPAYPIKHHKKKHTIRSVPILTEKHYEAEKDTALKMVKPTTPIIETQIAAPVANKAVVKNIPADPKTDAAVRPVVIQAYLKANQTGLVYLHEQASYRSAVLASIPDHSQIRILEKGDGFYKIDYNGQTGFVPRWTVVQQ